VVTIVSEEALKEDPGDKAYDRWIELEKMIKVVKGFNLHDPIKAAKMCLVLNVIVLRDF
jgi:hypothetical protein